MQRKSVSRTVLAALIGGVLMSLAVTPARAGGGVSQGHGIKCSWVLVSTDPVTGANVYNFVCRRGI